MKKHIFAVIMIMALALALSVTAFAASGISAKEQELLDLFSEGVMLNDGVTHVDTPAKYIAQAEQYLIIEDLTDDEVNGLVDTVNAIYAIIKEEGYVDVPTIKHSDRYDEIVSIAQAGALTVRYEIGPGNLIDGADIVKQTGSGIIVTVVIASAVFAALVACFVFVGKKNLSGEKA